MISLDAIRDAWAEEKDGALTGNHYYSQGDIIFMNFSPQRGHEQKGRRPALIVSQDTFNRMSTTIYVCPITSKDRCYPFHVPLDERTKTSGVIMADQLRSVDVRARDAEFVEKAPKEITLKVLSLISKITGPS